MRRLILVLGAILTLWFGGRAILRLFKSDETRIRDVVESMVDGFNATRAAPVLEGLDARFLDENYGADRELVHAALVQLFFTAKDESTKKFLYRAEVEAADIVVTKAAGEKPPRATAELELAFFRRQGETEVPAWKLGVHAELEETDGEWRLVRTSSRTLEGRAIR